MTKRSMLDKNPPVTNSVTKFKWAGHWAFERCRFLIPIDGGGIWSPTEIEDSDGVGDVVSFVVDG